MVENKQLFDGFYSKKQDIERLFGEPLIWDRLDSKQACRIKFEFTCDGLANEVRWPEVQERLVISMRRLSDAIRQSGAAA